MSVLMSQNLAAPLPVFHDRDCDLSIIRGKRVAVIGYGSHGSDMDDQLSVESASSDSGIGLGNGGNAMTSCNGNNNAGSVASHFPHLSITDV